MSASTDTEIQIAALLARDLDLPPGSDADWLRRVVEAFPIPTVREAPALIGAIHRLVRAVPWAAELLKEDFLEPLGRLATTMDQLPGRRPEVYGNYSDEKLRQALRGDFLLAATLHGFDTGLGLSPGSEALRLVLLVCQWRWAQSDNPRRSYIDDLGSAIRGTSRSALDPRLQIKMGQAKTLAEFLEVAAGLASSAHITLATAWRLHIEPELRDAARPSAPPRPVEAGPGPEIAPRPNATPSIPAGPRSRVRSRLGVTDDDELVDRLHSRIRNGAPPRPPEASDPLPGESVEEVSPSLLISPMVRAPNNPDAEGVARYQLQQAIWSTNHLLLPNHPDVLPYKEYRRAVQGVLVLLRDPAVDADFKYGGCGLLLQALIGRTPKTLTALDVLENGKAAHDPRRLEFLVSEGALRFSCFWQVPRGDFEPSYFRPTDPQLAYLEEVGGHFVLPLVPPILEVFRVSQDLLRAFATTNVSQTEYWVRQAAARVGEAQDLRFTAGQLRASASAHLFEQCRDVAATQLLCADTLGMPSSSLSYYAPRSRALATIHWTFQAGLLEIDDQPPAAMLSETRVGARLLVKQEVAEAMVGSLAAGLGGLSGAARDRADPAQIHGAMVLQLSGMLVALGTHRPTEALFELTVGDVWIEGDVGAALLRDKVCDAAHDPRLIALPATICQQIRAYLDHLVGLAERLPETLPHVQAVLAGRKPLLFGIDARGQPQAISLAEWKSLLPPLWRELPANWGRHWVRTRAVELGIRPELVNIQMGHLEVAGYPFSGASPTEPRVFIEELAPCWEALARAQGWQVIRGLRRRSDDSLPTLPPLHPWKSRIQAHEARQRAMAQQWRKAMLAQLRTYREAAEAVVLAHPLLKEAGIVERFHATGKALKPHSLKRQDFERIRDQLFDEAGDDLAKGIAQANALCRVAATVNRRTRQAAETPGKIVKLRRPLDNAFVPGMMVAVRQVEALREHVGTLVDDKAISEQADMTSACSRVVLAMVLFGYCEEPGQILGALQRRTKLQRSAKIQDLVLVPWGDQAHQVLALRGVAAPAFARLAWKFRKEEVPDWRDLEDRLLEWLPAWAIGDKRWREGAAGRLVEALCETAGMAHRFELSPGARRALAARGGATPAHQREQLAFLDGDPAGTNQRTWQEGGDAASKPTPGSVVSFTPGPRKGNARSQYLKLCAIFPSAGKDTALPLTGASIGSGNAVSPESRKKVLEEIRAQLALQSPERRLQPIVQILASWVEDMIAHGTPGEDNPALSTVETYLTRIGGSLVHIFGQSSMAEVSEAELEDAYLATVGAQVESRSKTAAAVLLFHKHAQDRYGLPEVDQSGIRLFQREAAEGLADADLIMPSERTAVIRRLRARASEVVAARGANEGRILRQASQVLPMIALAGPRRSEPLGLQFRDLRIDGDTLRARLRPNHSRRLKTVNARRVIEVPLLATSVEGTDLAGWVDIERERLKTRHLETAFVFSQSDSPFDAKVRTAIAEACLQACREVTGRRLSRLHSFRHLVAMERTTAPFLHEADLAALSETVPLVPSPTQSGRIALPRDLQAQVVSLGHGDAATTITWYHHLPWLLRSRADQRLSSRYLTRSVAASLLGVSRFTLDWANRQRPDRPRPLAWLDVQCDLRVVPMAPASIEAVTVPVDNGAPTRPAIIGPWTARELGTLLQEVTRVGSLEKALLVRGMTLKDADPLRLGLLGMEQRLGRRLFDERDRTSGPRRPQRVLRRIESGARFEMLWDWYDSDRDQLRAALARLAEAVHEFMLPVQSDRISLPPPEAEELLRLVTRLGVQPAQIRQSLPESGLLTVRILRDLPDEGANEMPKKSERYLGQVLKSVLLVIRLVHRQR